VHAPRRKIYIFYADFKRNITAVRNIAMLSGIG